MATQATAQAKPQGRAEEPEWMVWALVALLLVAGLLIKLNATGQVVQATESGITLNYPAGWTRMVPTDPTQTLYAADSFSSAGFPTQVQIHEYPLADVGRNLEALGDINLAWSTRHGRDLMAYRALNVQTVTLDGQTASALEYAYIPTPAQGGDATGLPVVVQAEDLLLKQGDQLIVITFTADAAHYAELAETWQAIQASIQVQ